MESEDVNMDEFLCFKGKSQAQDEDNFFNREKTLRLLDLYKQYKKRLGTFEVKSMKKLWELALSNEYRITVLGSKCENRFKVLERNYKKVVDNNNKTGRGRKVFEFENEMDEIFGKKKNINPVLLLSSQQNINVRATLKDRQVEISIPDIEVMPSCSTSTEHINNKINIEEPNIGNKIPDNPTPKENKSLKRKRIATPTYQKRNDILSDIKNDLKRFYEKRDQRDAEKIEITRKKLEARQERAKIAREYLEFLKQKGTDGGTDSASQADK